MPTISEYFDIGKSQAELDFVDVRTDADTRLYLDPAALAHSSDQWSIRCGEAIRSLFSSVLDAIRAQNHDRGRRLLNHLQEPNETRLGLSSGRPAGRGIGQVQAGDLYQKIQDSRAAETGVLSELSDCELFVPGIGPDKVSDIDPAP